MKQAIIILASTAFALGGPGAAAQDEPDEAEIGVVKIFSATYDRRGRNKGAGSGSGFVINDRGYIATNHHVVNGRTTIYVVPDGGSVSGAVAYGQSNATVIDADEELDIAILRVNDPSAFKPATLASVLPEKGKQVYAVGFPGSAEARDLATPILRVDATITTGVLSRKSYGPWTNSGKPLEQLQHSADVSWGNSGGPLKDECGRVIGINTEISLKAIGNNMTVVPGVNFASNISELFKILDVHGIEYSALDIPCLSTADQSAEDLVSIQRTLRWTLVSGAAALGALLFAGVMLLRRPRERVVQVVESYSHALRRSGQGERSTMRPAEQGRPQQGQQTRAPVRLIGRDSKGGEVRMDMDDSRLRRGVVVGRATSDRAFDIPDDSVSRAHAQFGLDGEKLTIKDLGSTNGTYVNGRKLKEHAPEAIRAGDEIKLGGVVISVR